VNFGVSKPGDWQRHRGQVPRLAPERISMNEPAQTATVTPEILARIEEHVRCRLTGRVRDIQLVFRDQGLVLRGHVHTYYAKQLAQHAVMEASGLPIRANEMEVS